jgi:hypothetical protein
VHVPEYAPVHIYRFNFLKQATHLFSNPAHMNDSLWLYNPQVHPVSGDRVYAKMNTGDFWKLGDEYVKNCVNALDPSLHCDGLPHRFSPVILFIDSTLIDRIRCLKVEPVLCSFRNISGSNRSAALSWFILRFIPPNPKSS